MTYRASLGTRGELRRIAAEAETVTIDRVRPWVRTVQHCRLAPHVIVPQWTRLEHPVKPKPPPPLVSQSRIVAGEFVEEILESATAKKFRRGRGRRGRPRKRPEAALNQELRSAETEGKGDKAFTEEVQNSESASGAVEIIIEDAKDAQDIREPAETKEVDGKPLETIGLTEKDNEEAKISENKDEDVTKVEFEAMETLRVETQSQLELTVGGESTEKKLFTTTDEDEPAVGQNENIEMMNERVAEEVNAINDVEMTEASPVSKEMSS